jgi:hypothetical protein
MAACGVAENYRKTGGMKRKKSPSWNYCTGSARDCNEIPAVAARFRDCDRAGGIPLETRAGIVFAVFDEDRREI